MPDVPSPELLVPLLRDSPDFSGVRTPAQWAAIQEVAVTRRMAAVVAYAIREHASPEQRRWCDQTLAHAWRRHDECIRQLDYVLGLLSEGGIEVLCLKGPILGRLHFPLPFLRRASVDIDLAVRDSDLERAALVLTQNGYCQESTILEARTTSHHLVMSIDNRPRVELHTRLSHATRGVPVDELFHRAEHHPLPTGRVARIPGPADELLGLLLHLANDRFSSFFHLFEFRRIWRRADDKLRHTVVQEAIKHHFSAVLWLTEIAMRSVWNEPFLPTDAIVPRTWLQNRLNLTLLNELAGTVAGGDKRTLALRLRGRWLDLQTTDTVADAIKMLALIIRVALRELPPPLTPAR